MKIRSWMIVSLIAACIVVIYLCSYIVRTGQVAIVTSFGRPTAIREEPGLYFKLPAPFAVVNRFDARMQLYSTDLVEYLTADKKNLILQAFVCWKVKDPLTFFQTVYSFSNFQEKLDDVLSSLIGATLGEHKMHQVISTEADDIKLDEMADSVALETGKRTSNYGIEVLHVGFSRIALPEDNALSVHRRMIAERSAIANEYRAIGRQKAAEIRADTDREKAELLAIAERDAEIIKGEGEARAAEIYSEAYAEYPEFFKFIRNLETDKKVLSKQTTLVLSSDSELIGTLAPQETRK
jgi:modulator of FtsH protease HflC